MKHQVQVWRGDDLHIFGQYPSLEKAKAARDVFITQAHNGELGIGLFQIYIYELAPEGNIERCVEPADAFHIPTRQKETA